jgi:hypothetical protein
LPTVHTVIKQAHERIIGGRKVLNKDKVFSLYDEDVQVIVRGKSNAEVEFGNNLWKLARLEQAEVAEALPKAA